MHGGFRRLANPIRIGGCFTQDTKVDPYRNPHAGFPRSVCTFVRSRSFREPMTAPLSIYTQCCHGVRSPGEIIVSVSFRWDPRQESPALTQQQNEIIAVARELGAAGDM